MNRSRLSAILIVIALAGFAAGKFSSQLPAARTTDGAKDIPLFPAPPKSDPASLVTGDIVIETPTEGSYVAPGSLEVSGRAKEEGGDLRISIKDASGTEIAASKAEMTSVGGGFGRFSATFAFAVRPTGSAVIEISRASGDGIAAVRRVTFDEVADGSGESVSLRVFFHNSTLSTGDDCALVSAVERVVPSKTAGYRSALEALLAGPNDEERARGYTSAIPSSARLKSAVVDAKGEAIADFTSELQRGVAGSCRVTAIRSQIESTLKQFPEVRTVTIEVNGSADGVLQP